MGERLLSGAYSASVDLQNESARLVFSGELPVEKLISHRFSLEDIQAGIELALHPDEQSLKIVIEPQEGALTAPRNLTEMDAHLNRAAADPVRRLHRGASHRGGHK
jgi:hypothetical protein